MARSGWPPPPYSSVPGRHVTLAGATGVSARLVVVLDLAGTLIYLVGLHAGIRGGW